MSEFAMQCRIASALRGFGLSANREQSYIVMPGERVTADFVCNGWAVECKRDSSQDSILKALGQCVAYIALGLAKNGVIVTPKNEVICFTLWLAIRRAGIHVSPEPELPGLLLGQWTSEHVPEDAQAAFMAWVRYAHTAISHQL